MEIVIENPSSDGSAISKTPLNPGFASHPGHHRPYRATYVSASEGGSPVVDYYGTLQAPRPRSRLVSPEPDFEVAAVPMATSVRRVDRSGLLEIAELEPQRNSSRARHLTGAENPSHSGTLTRRIDRSGLLEAVPEVPDQCQGWRSPEKSPTSVSEDSRPRSVTERQLTGAEIDKSDESHQQTSQNRQQSTSPRKSKPPIEPAALSAHRRSSETLTSHEDSRTAQETRKNVSPSPTSVHGLIGNSTTLSSSISSPYLRRYPAGSPTLTLDRPTAGAPPADDPRTRNRNSFACVSPNATKFLPIDALPSRTRQSYVDLTGASYTRTSATSPISRTSVDCATEPEKKRIQQQQPDCLGRLSPRLRSDRNTSLTFSAIPDVIEAHGSRNLARDSERDGAEDAPEGERAEAEGCEHSALETLEETRVSFKAPNKILHNDNIQTLRVIILSEQL